MLDFINPVSKQISHTTQISGTVGLTSGGQDERTDKYEAIQNKAALDYYRH